MNNKGSASGGGIILVIIIAIWFAGGFGDDSSRKNRKIAKAYYPLGQLIFETKFKWAKTVGTGLKLAGNILELDYILSDGEKGRLTFSLSNDQSNKLQTGHKVKLKDPQGQVKNVLLDEIYHKDVHAGPVFVRYRLPRLHVKTMNRASAFEWAHTLKQIPGMPYWIRPISPYQWEVRYGPLPNSQRIWCVDLASAESSANDLRAMGLFVAVDR